MDVLLLFILEVMVRLALILVGIVAGTVAAATAAIVGMILMIIQGFKKEEE